MRVFYGKLVVLVLVSSSVLFGCGFKDIDKRLFVSAIGIDPPEVIEEGYKVTLKIALPFGAIKESTKPSYAYLSRESASIGEAIRMLETHLDKIVELGHMKAIIVHEDMVSEHIKTVMDYFIRRGDIQLISYIAGARPSAETILKVEPATEAPASVALFNFFGGTANESPYIVTTYLFQLRRDRLAKGKNAVIPLIETSEQQDQLIVNHALVVRDRKEPIELSSSETNYFNSLLNGATGFSFQVKSGHADLLLDIKQSKMKYSFVYGPDGVTPVAMDIQIKMKGVIGESNDRLALSKLDDYNQMASEEVRKKTVSLLKRMQEEQIDPFGFGLRFRATRLHHEDVMDRWEAAYPTMEFRVTANVALQTTGAIE